MCSPPTYRWISSLDLLPWQFPRRSRLLFWIRFARWPEGFCLPLHHSRTLCIGRSEDKTLGHSLEYRLEGIWSKKQFSSHLPVTARTDEKDIKIWKKSSAQNWRLTAEWHIGVITPWAPASRALLIIHSSFQGTRIIGEAPWEVTVLTS